MLVLPDAAAVIFRNRHLRDHTRLHMLVGCHAVQVEVLTVTRLESPFIEELLQLRGVELEHFEQRRALLGRKFLPRTHDV